MGELEGILVLVQSKAELQLVNLFFCEEGPQMFGVYISKGNTEFSQNGIFYIYGKPKKLNL